MSGGEDLAEVNIYTECIFYYTTHCSGRLVLCEINC